MGIIVIIVVIILVTRFMAPIIDFFMEILAEVGGPIWRVLMGLLVIAIVLATVVKGCSSLLGGDR